MHREGRLGQILRRWATSVATGLAIAAIVATFAFAVPRSDRLPDTSRLGSRLAGASQIRTGSILLSDIKRGQLESRFLTLSAAAAKYVKISDLAAAHIIFGNGNGNNQDGGESPKFLRADVAAVTYLKIDAAAQQYLKITDAALKYLSLQDAAFKYLKIDAAANTYLKLDAASAQYLKIADADLKYLKITDSNSFLKIEAANSTFLKIEDAAQKYLKIDEAAAKFLKIDEAGALYLKIEDANLKFLKIADANAAYLKIDAAAASYLKIDAAAQKYLKIDDAGTMFLKLSDAAEKYLKIDAANATYLKIDDAGTQYLKIGDAAKKYLSLEEAANYLKIAEGDARYIKLGDAIAGHGAVFTGVANLVAGARKTVLTVPGIVQVDAVSPQGTEGGTTFVLIALRPVNGEAQLAGGTLQSFSLATGEGKLLPAVNKDAQATIQLLETDDRGVSQVVTLTISGMPFGGAEPHLSVFGQALVGTP